MGTERNSTKKQLLRELAAIQQRESERKYRNIVESMPLGMHLYRVEKDGRFVFIGANPAADRILGVDNTQFIGKTIEEAFPALTATEIPEQYRQVALEGKTWHTDQVCYDEDQISGVFSVYAFQTSPGNMVAVFQDVTENTRKDHALRERDEHFKAVVEYSPVAIGIVDQQGKILQLNKKFTDLFGYTKEDIPTVFDWYPLAYPDKAYRESVIALWEHDIQRAIIEQKETPPREYQVTCKDGTVRDIEITMNILGSRQLVIFTDVTEQKRILRQLEESEEKFRLLVETSGDAIFQINMDGVFTYCSPATVNVLGYTPEELLGTNFAMHYAPSISDEDAEAFHRVLTGERVELLELQAFHKDGFIIHAEVSVAPFMKEGHVIGIQGIARNITQRRQAEEALHQAYTDLETKTIELENANEALSQYAYVASHDLKTPLRAIHNYVDFLSEELGAILNAEQRVYMHGLIQAVRDAERLIDDLLQLAQLNQRDFPAKNVDVGILLHKLIATLGLPSDVEVILPAQYPTMTTQPVLLQQIFQNLIDNAVMFNHSSPRRIELGWQDMQEDHYEFFVRDNGIGIDPRYHQQIFRAFERLHLKEEYEGSGIGLTIVKKAVANLGGTIRVESIPGKGSTFFVTLPKTLKDNI